MGTISTFILITIAAIALFNIYSVFQFRNKTIRSYYKRLDWIHLLYEKLLNRELSTHQDIYLFARNRLPREDTYKLLSYFHLSNLFPTEFYTFESSAESNLAKWLEYPTELNACPDAIEHVKQVTVHHERVHVDMQYHVYKFNVNEPNEAAARGWMLGVVGPYTNQSKPYDNPPATFSRLKNENEIRSA